MKAVKEDTSAPGPSNVVINEKTSMSAVNKDTSVQAVLPVPTPSTKYKMDKRLLFIRKSSSYECTNKPL